MGKPTKSSGNSKEGLTNTRARSVAYSVELVDHIMDRISAGEPVSKICEGDNMPSGTSFYEWLGKYPDMVLKYNAALAARAHKFAEEIMEISDDGKRDYVIGKEGVLVDHDHIARSRLRVDSRKWLASKMLPKVYGDKMAVGGAEDLGPVRTITRDMTAEEAYALMMTGKGKLATASQESNEDLM